MEPAIAEPGLIESLNDWGKLSFDERARVWRYFFEKPSRVWDVMILNGNTDSSERVYPTNRALTSAPVREALHERELFFRPIRVTIEATGEHYRLTSCTITADDFLYYAEPVGIELFADAPLACRVVRSTDPDLVGKGIHDFPSPNVAVAWWHMLEASEKPDPQGNEDRPDRYRRLQFLEWQFLTKLTHLRNLNVVVHPPFEIYTIHSAATRDRTKSYVLCDIYDTTKIDKVIAAADMGLMRELSVVEPADIKVTIQGLRSEWKGMEREGEREGRGKGKEAEEFLRQLFGTKASPKTIRPAVLFLLNRGAAEFYGL